MISITTNHAFCPYLADFHRATPFQIMLHTAAIINKKNNKTPIAHFKNLHSFSTNKRLNKVFNFYCSKMGIIGNLLLTGSGTIQCFYKEGHNINKNKRLFYSTILPGFLEAITYSIPLVLLPIFLFLLPVYALAFLIGDTVFSLLGTLVLMPKKFFKTLIHYHQIFFFKYLNAAVFVYALVKVTAQAINGKTKSWYNEWMPLQTDYALVR